MNGALIRVLEAMLKELGVRVEALVAERDELKRERDELRRIIESAGRLKQTKTKSANRFVFTEAQVEAAANAALRVLMEQWPEETQEDWSGEEVSEALELQRKAQRAALEAAGRLAMDERSFVGGDIEVPEDLHG